MTRTRHLVRLALKVSLLAGLAAAVALGLFAGAIALGKRRPLALPVPTGPYAVGRALYDWTDPGRTDPLAPQPGTARELPVWVWYPAEASAHAAPAAYLPGAWAQARQQAGVGALDYDPAFIQPHALADAPLARAQASYPVLIMAPGMGPAAPDYTVLAEELASHGYVVVAINPTYTSFAVAFADGRIVLRSGVGAIPDRASPAEAEQDAERIGAVWADDVIYAMDELARVNADAASPFCGRLDLARMGVFGHSFGGATALAVCRRDGRCRAGADLDGTPLAAAQQGRLRQPFMLMVEDWGAGCDDNCAAIRAAYARVDDGGAYLVAVAGTRHFSFSDLLLRQVPAVRPFFALAGLSGPTPPARALDIANAYLVAFFDASLKGEASPLLAGPAPAYPEVRLSRH